MGVFDKVEKMLRLNGFEVTVCANKEEAAEYLNGKIDGVSVGIGGSKTVEALGLYEMLTEHNEVYWHWKMDPDYAREKAATTDVYLCSANGLAETGEIINVDGNGNRVASTLWGHKKIYFVIGRNKLAPDYDAAVARCRNIACTTRVADFDLEATCAKAGTTGVKCWDCHNQHRACRGMVTLWMPMENIDYEVFLFDEDLGY